MTLLNDICILLSKYFKVYCIYFDSGASLIRTSSYLGLEPLWFPESANFSALGALGNLTSRGFACYT